MDEGKIKYLARQLYPDDWVECEDSRDGTVFINNAPKIRNQAEEVITALLNSGWKPAEARLPVLREPLSSGLRPPDTETQKYCPVCERHIKASNINEVNSGEHDGYLFVHDDIPHSDDELAALSAEIQ